MTDRDIDQIKEAFRDVIKEELTDLKGWQTLDEICHTLSRKRHTIWRWAKNGQIKTMMIGHVKMYKVV